MNHPYFANRGHPRLLEQFGLGPLVVTNGNDYIPPLGVQNWSSTVSLLAAITYGVYAIAYGIGALMVIGLGCQDNVALRVCHFAALDVTVRRCASIGNSSGSVPFRSVNDTVSKRQSASNLLQYYQCSQDKERREGEVDVPRKRAPD
jgi:hypothetical protein